MSTKESLKKISHLKGLIDQTLTELNEVSKSEQRETKNPDQAYILNELQGLKEHLSDIARWISYLNSPILLEGTLKYRNNRYCIDDKTLKQEDMVEVFKKGLWQRCLVYEISDRQCIQDFSESELTGCTARLRERMDDEVF